VRHQHVVWESIAASFDRNRTRRWPHVEAYLARLAPSSRVLDLMGGNGRHVAAIENAGHRALWLDWSRPASRIVHERYGAADVVCADATHLPLADASADAAIWVAGLHSLTTPESRASALAELHRVLRPGGSAQITVWSRDAPKFAAQGTPGEPFDVVLPWRSDGHDEPRHYHLYTAKALRTAVEHAGFEVVAETSLAVVSKEPDNLVVEVRKHE
jgi:ubiquinone/menaquinone biosynthesis C-methylase UbiE